jgi:FO synthase
MPTEALRNAAMKGAGLDEREALALAQETDTASLMRVALQLRDAAYGDVVTYSRKVFLPLTHLCRDVCHYCTFARTPRHIESPYMALDEVLDVARQGDQLGCHEALLTLGEKPELRYRAAREALQDLGCDSTLHYVARVAGAILEQTGLLPHINAGCMTAEEMAMLRPVSASMGIMLESTSERLCAKGGPHYGSPDKIPAHRLATIELAGQLQVPFTSGILIGIGETRVERIESLLALRRLHRQYGHLQEIIIQNFKAKPATLMAEAPEPDLNELLWTIAVARLVFGPQMSIQAPPNLSPGVLPRLVDAGINDWGGVSPLTPDYVNPEAPWPHVDQLVRETKVAGKNLVPRLTVYPRFIAEHYRQWLDPALHTRVLQAIDGEGYPRMDDWRTGQSARVPAPDLSWLEAGSVRESVIDERLRAIVARARAGERLSEDDIVTLFSSREDAFGFVCQQADELRQDVCGDSVSYVVNRNINYTNICYFKCQFCAFSKGKLSENLRGSPYNLSLVEIVRRASEAWDRGATEVCLQGGIHPHYSGNHYLDICRAIKRELPAMHIHAFSPLEIWQGAATLGLELPEFLRQLMDAGLDTLPGTAAEILDDEVRAVLCADKVNTEQWLQVMASAHDLGIRTTATVMFGHVDGYRHWARHLLHIRDLQARTGGFTEFVPLPFVGAEAPIYLKGNARNGPSFRESVLMHAVARLVLYPHVTNIQASWVKMGQQGVLACLRAGANDLGGTLMNESITRAAGASHGEELAPETVEQLLAAMGRAARQRTTLYGEPSTAQQLKSYRAQALVAPINTPQREFDRDHKPARSAGKRAPAEQLLRNPPISSAISGEAIGESDC